MADDRRTIGKKYQERARISSLVAGSRAEAASQRSSWNLESGRNSKSLVTQIPINALMNDNNGHSATKEILAVAEEGHISAEASQDRCGSPTSGCTNLAGRRGWGGAFKLQRYTAGLEPWSFTIVLLCEQARLTKPSVRAGLILLKPDGVVIIVGAIQAFEVVESSQDWSQAAPTSPCRSLTVGTISVWFEVGLSLTFGRSSKNVVSYPAEETGHKLHPKPRFDPLLRGLNVEVVHKCSSYSEESRYITGSIASKLISGLMITLASGLLLRFYVAEYGLNT
ncbi:hypothetical protein KCU71_g39, partial [Aureobasidium melanogenum]